MKIIFLFVLLCLTFVLMFGSLPVKAATLALVRGTFTARDIPSEAEGSRVFRDNVAAALDGAGISYESMTDEDVVTGKLTGFDLAILPYNASLAPAEEDSLIAFSQRGGKLIVFYSTTSRMMELLGIHLVRWMSQEYPGQFTDIKLNKEILPGTPDAVRENSWNIQSVEPVSPSVQSLGEWIDSNGKGTGIIAGTIGPNGAYISYVITSGDTERKSRLILALVGHYLPSVWETSAKRSVEGVFEVGGLTTREALLNLRPETGAPRTDFDKWLSQADADLTRAKTAINSSDWPMAVDVAASSRRSAVAAYLAAMPSRQGELRGVWIHTAYGVQGYGWERSIRTLHENGFNAIFPNMLWAGVAHYPSQIQPVDPRAQKEGDQIAECLKWCRQYGVELHVWKVNWNLATASKEYIQQMRAAGRTQKNNEGKDVDWLCPSHPANFELERDAMLEVARNYAVDGLHFDYIRYPDSDACFCEGCRDRFQQQTGLVVADWPKDVLTGSLKSQFADWRRDQITRLVEAVSTEARRIRPGIQISAAVFGNWKRDRNSVGQDWKLWIEKGYLDFVCPMDYTADPKAFQSLVERQREWVAGRVPLYPGIGAFIISGADRVAEQIRIARTYGGDGFVLFDYSPTTATEILPGLHNGATRTEVLPPHRALKAKFEIPEGLPGTLARYAANMPPLVRIRAPRLVTTANVELRDMNDNRIATVGKLSTRQKLLAYRLPMREGFYRLAVVTRKPGKPDLVSRSATIELVSAVVMEQEAARQRPPVIEGKGIRIGVYARGYGTTSILKGLEGQPGLRVFPLEQLSEPFLKVCQVLILTQPHDFEDISQDWWQAVQKWVSDGGSVFLTHDACGYRNCPVLFPDIARGDGRVDSTTWEPLGKGLTAGMETRPLPHSYYDHIVLAPGKKGVVEGVDTDGKPLVVSGEHGKGRVVACGMVIGLNNDDKDAPPTASEIDLLKAAISWFGK